MTYSSKPMSIVADLNLPTPSVALVHTRIDSEL